MSEEIAKKITIYGKVHGVFMRATLKDFADELDLVGYVKNNPDNTVEVIVQGYVGPVTNFINFCKQGSDFAKVDSVETENIALSDYNDFSINN